MLSGAWWIVASPAASVIAAFVVLCLLIHRGFHRERDGCIARRRLASLVVLSASTYTFAVLVLSQLVLKGPKVSFLISDGFGDSRIAWLLLGVTLDGAFRVWDEFRHL